MTKNSEIIIDGFISKPKLYSLIDHKLKELSITHENYPLNSIEIAKLHSDHLEITLEEFDSIDIGGILYKNEPISLMCLNKSRSEKGRNFDCMHELIHYWFHPADRHFCVDIFKITQNRGKEWQANEGAAHALMPEKTFIEKYYEHNGDIERLSDYFYVGEQAIQYRINSLKNVLKDNSKKYYPEKSKTQNLQEIFDAAQKLKCFGNENNH